MRSKRSLAAGRAPGRAPDLTEGLGVYLKKDAEGRKVFGATASLFRIPAFLEVVRNHARERNYHAALYEAFEAAMVGVIEVGEIDPEHGRCHGAWEVKRVAGPRFAETLYGIGFALSPAKLLAPDRRNVSLAAARVWARQAKMGRRAAPFEPFSSGGPGACLRYRDRAPELDFAFAAEGWEVGLLNRLNLDGLKALSRAKVSLNAPDRDLKDVLDEVSWNFWEHRRPKAEEQRGLYHLSSWFED